MTFEVLEIESLDLEGRGVAHHEGKVVFVEGALPGERVSVRWLKRKASFDTARMEHIVRPSSQRVTPPCPSFGLCGGCAMQHLEPAAQVAAKQRVLEDALRRIGKVQPGQILPALHGPTWGYRYRARLSVRLVRKKGQVLVGFRERRGAYVADMSQCLVLPQRVSKLLVPLRALIAGLSEPERVPQIEVAVSEYTIALLLRHLEPLSQADRAALEAFGDEHGVSWWLQPQGLDSVHLLRPEQADLLAYNIPEFGLRMPYRPTDFTQVNEAVNRSLISTALRLLDVRATDRVADLFCGLGNFTLPLATQARTVVGIEGSSTLTDRAVSTAKLHGLEGSTSFATLNLFEVDEHWLRELGYFDRMLIDPPREGALAVATAISGLMPAERPRRIVYVSCSPATLARDAGILVHEAGYRLTRAGVVNMFPHTGHVESIAVFEAQEA
jgi:23S rRNA (uracil1939-C5)-methyltransferase